jgi:hypothetical protein
MVAGRLSRAPLERARGVSVATTLAAAESTLSEVPTLPDMTG